MGDSGSAPNPNLQNTGLFGSTENLLAAILSACGVEYSEAEAGENVDGEWEVVKSTTDRDGTADPLALMLGINGKPGLTVKSV